MLYLIADADRQVAKLGYSKNPAQRLKQIQTGYPKELKIIAVCRGNTQDESKIHHWLSPGRKHGEWFEWNEKIDLLLERWGPLPEKW